MALRDPVPVIDAVLAVDGVPDQMRRKLDLIRREQPYKAPEQRLETFWAIQDVFSIHVPEPPEETWQLRAVAAWMGLTEAEVLEKFGGPLAVKEQV